MRRVLIADGDELGTRSLQRELQRCGFATHAACSGADVQELALGDEYDLLILDLDVPGGDGLDLLLMIRAAGRRIPIIVLSGRAFANDAERCLNAGADDFMRKPFRFGELRARIEARLRADRRPAATTLSCDAIELHRPSRRVAVHGCPVSLTAREFTLLELLMRHKGQVLTRGQIITHVWSANVDPTSNVVDVCVVGLRRKLATDAIESVRGIGYRFTDVPTPLHSASNGRATMKRATSYSSLSRSMR